MRKYFLFVLTMTVAASASFGQAGKAATDKIKKDPKTIEMQAKADAALLNKKNSIDSVAIKISVPANNQPAYKFKSKNKSRRKTS